MQIIRLQSNLFVNALLTYVAVLIVVLGDSPLIHGMLPCSYQMGKTADTCSFTALTVFRYCYYKCQIHLLTCLAALRIQATAPDQGWLLRSILIPGLTMSESGFSDIDFFFDLTAI